MMPPPSPPIPSRRRIRVWALALLLLPAALAGLLWLLLAGSLPRLDGPHALEGLSAPVTIERDALGTATIRANNATDAMRALGYVHAQERYFEMDLARRVAAGELAELVGSSALDSDRRHRIHRMRARVDADLALLDPHQRALLDAYVAGVNAGLSDLPVRPWPYLLLRQSPRPWTAQDSLLVGMAMYFDLQDASDADALAWWRLRQRLPAPLFDLLRHDGSRWDAPLTGTPRGDAPLPTPDQVNLRTLAAAPVAHVLQDLPVVGSNNFAVSGLRTADRRAIVEDDMHLTLRAPNLWFRARLSYPDPQAPAGRVDITGFSLPGLPAIVVGSTGYVAWGFTNSYIDTADWLRLRPCTPQRLPGCTPVTSHREIIRVAGQPPQVLHVDETPWGPILHRDPDGHAYALRWVAHLPGALNLGLTRFTHARNVQDVFALGDHVALPTQNLMVADRAGHIGWRLLGPIPQRSSDCSASHWVEDSAAPKPCPPWNIATDRAPRVYDPPSGQLWTANNRLLDGEQLASVGDGGYALGARARQIRDALAARPQLDEHHLLEIALDDHARLLTPWYQLLRAQAARQRTPALQALALASADWSGRASPESAGYRLVRAWRQAVLERIARGLTAPAQTATAPPIDLPRVHQLEGIAWPLVQQQPLHLLPSAYASWDALFEDAAQSVRTELVQQGPLAERRWGERNTTHICHPLAAALPQLTERFLCMPFMALPGDADMPRVQGPAFGASERMVVSPGHEADGLTHMPGGQSGHPLSPFWGAGHTAWAKGQPTPFLPGQPLHRLQLQPPAPAVQH